MVPYTWVWFTCQQSVTHVTSNQPGVEQLLHCINHCATFLLLARYVPNAGKRSV